MPEEAPRQPGLAAGRRCSEQASSDIFLESAAEELRADPDVVLEAVRQNGLALQFAAEGLRASQDIVLEAVRQQGRALFFAAKELRARPDIVLEAVRQDSFALHYAAKELRASPDIVLEAVRQDGEALRLAPTGVRGDLRILRAAVRTGPNVLKWATDSAKADMGFIVEAMRLHGDAVIEYASSDLRAQGDVLRSLAACSEREALPHLLRMYKERNCRLEAVQQELEVVKQQRSSEQAAFERAAAEQHRGLEAAKERVAQLEEELRRQCMDQRLLLDASGVSKSYMHEVLEFARSIPTMQPSDEPVEIPVGALRFTHHTVNADLAFGDDHANQQESIFKLIDGLFRGVTQPEDLELDVFLHTGPDGVRGLFSRCNRRTLALQCLQAMRRDSAIRVRCRVYSSDDRRPSPVAGKSMQQWFWSGYDKRGSTRSRNAPPCNGLGLSIWPRFGSSKHRGYDLFSPAATARRSLSRAHDRLRRRQPGGSTTLQAVEHVLSSMEPRRARGQDEDTITLRSGGDPRA